MSAALQSAQSFQWSVSSDAQPERWVWLLGSSSPYGSPQTVHTFFVEQVAVPPVWVAFSISVLQAEQVFQWPVSSNIQPERAVWLLGSSSPYSSPQMVHFFFAEQVVVPPE